MRIRILALLWVTTSVLATATAVGCARDSAPMSHGQTSTAASPDPSVTPLQPNDRGYVRIDMPATSVGCSITAELVACERFSGAWHDTTGQVRHTVSVSTGGEFHWVEADLGELRGRVSLRYRTYSALGWSIFAQPGVTRFVNDLGGHGMTVGAERVTPF
jgi:hypothetical protein